VVATQSKLREADGRQEETSSPAASPQQQSPPQSSTAKSPKVASTLSQVVIASSTTLPTNSGTASNQLASPAEEHQKIFAALRKQPCGVTLLIVNTKIEKRRLEVLLKELMACGQIKKNDSGWYAMP
jgi:predicted Rossmann fold nucleotide-binding protein DprA/Smf involved in DNA uptake